ncbi:RNA polymerase sigma factor [Terrisporobacter sp.]
MGLTLLEKAAKGDKIAFKKLVQRDSEFIYKLAFLHTKYEDDAKKIMQNSILYINDSINRFSKIKKYRKLTDYEKFITKVTIKKTNEYLEEVGMVDHNNINYIDENGNIDMYKAIDLLDIYQKNVVILIYFYNLTYKEVGEILDMNESTIKMYLRNSLKIMKDIIMEDALDGKQEAK